RHFALRGSHRPYAHRARHDDRATAAAPAGRPRDLDGGACPPRLDALLRRAWRGRRLRPRHRSRLRHRVGRRHGPRPAAAAGDLLAAGPAHAGAAERSERRAGAEGAAQAGDRPGERRAAARGPAAELAAGALPAATMQRLVPTARVGAVTYRDRDDDRSAPGGPRQSEAFVVKWTDLTFNVKKVQTFLDGIVAEGGGDWEEAVKDGLECAMRQLKWRADAKKVIILVGSSPPHPQDVPAIKKLIADWRGKGGVVSTIDVSLMLHEEFERQMARWLHNEDLKEVSPLPDFYKEVSASFGEMAREGGGQMIARGQQSVRGLGRLADGRAGRADGTRRPHRRRGGGAPAPALPGAARVRRRARRGPRGGARGARARRRRAAVRGDRGLRGLPLGPRHDRLLGALHRAL